MNVAPRNYATATTAFETISARRVTFATTSRKRPRLSRSAAASKKSCKPASAYHGAAPLPRKTSPSWFGLARKQRLASKCFRHTASGFSPVGRVPQIRRSPSAKRHAWHVPTCKGAMAHRPAVACAGARLGGFNCSAARQDGRVRLRWRRRFARTSQVVAYPVVRVRRAGNLC